VASMPIAISSTGLSRMKKVKVNLMEVVRIEKQRRLFRQDIVFIYDLQDPTISPRGISSFKRRRSHMYCT
jgi:hypothetical protein